MSAVAVVDPNPGLPSRPLSVGYLCSEDPAFEPQHGGIGSFVQTIARGLVQAGHLATVYGFGERDETSEDNGVRLHLVQRADPWSSMRTMQVRIRQALASGAIDVADSAEAEAHCLPGGTGTVVRCQGSHHFWCATLGCPKRYTRLVLEQFALRRADGLCAVSQFAADVTRRSMHLGRRPIEILYNPVDTDAFMPDRARVVRGSVLFVGGITEKKGVRELCASMPLVLQRHPGAQLSLVGRDIPEADGVLLREAIGATLAPQIRDRVHFLGARPRSEVSRLMASAHVCVFPSHMETQGIVLVEAMASGRPVVTSHRGPGPEVLGPDGECGLLADPFNSADIAEKICRVLDDEDAAWRMGQRGRKRAVDHFGMSTLFSQNLAFYRQHRYRR